jgi:hypothetical protein
MSLSDIFEAGSELDAESKAQVEQLLVIIQRLRRVDPGAAEKLMRLTVEAVNSQQRGPPLFLDDDSLTMGL